ncbi:MAG: hypothetical protein AAF531_07730 [Actinomycetota bacterium]
MPQPTDSSGQPYRLWPAGTRAAASVRLAVGLAHTAPGAELTLRRADGGELVAANRLGADIDLCALRRFVIDAVGRSAADRWVAVVGLGGSLARAEDGFWRSTDPDEHRRWFATFLRQDRIVELLGEIDTTDIGDDGIDVMLKPDPCLGVTSVRVSAEGSHLIERLDELTRRAASACVVDELIWSARQGEPQTGPAVGRPAISGPDDLNKGE